MKYACVESVGVAMRVGRRCLRVVREFGLALLVSVVERVLYTSRKKDKVRERESQVRT